MADGPPDAHRARPTTCATTTSRWAIGDEETAEFDATRHHRRARGALCASSATRPERIGNIRALAAPARRRRALGPRLQHRRGPARAAAREAQVPALLEALRHPVHVLRPAGDGADAAQGHGQARRARRRRADGALRRGRASRRTRRESSCRSRCSRSRSAEGTARASTPALARSPTAAELRDGLPPSCSERYRQPVLVETYLPGPRVHGRHRRHRAPRRACSASLEVMLLSDERRAGRLHLPEQGASARSGWTTAARRTTPPRDGERGRARRLARARLPRRGPRRPALRRAAASPCSSRSIRCPGLHPTHSDLPILCRPVGIAYGELIGAIMEARSPAQGVSGAG